MTSDKHKTSVLTALLLLFISLSVCGGGADTEHLLVEVLRGQSDFSEVETLHTISVEENRLRGTFTSRGQDYTIFYEQLSPRSGTLSIVVVFDDSEALVLLMIPEHSGRNSRLAQKGFVRRFRGKKPQKAPLKLGRGGIDAISGATVSAAQIVEAINSMSDFFKTEQ